jgi:hypothetical protein
MSKIGWRLVCVAALASAWGLVELIGGETVWLTAAGLFTLATGRALVNRFGMSSAMAAVAVLFKSVNTSPYFCHLVGIALLGIAFDLMATLWWRDDRRSYLRAAVAGVLSAYVSCFAFAAAMTWAFRYRFWADGGLARVGEHTLYSGSRGALAALVVAPLGLWLGRQLMRQADGHPRAVLRASVVVGLALWALGRFAV